MTFVAWHGVDTASSVYVVIGICIFVLSITCGVKVAIYTSRRRLHETFYATVVSNPLQDCPGTVSYTHLTLPTKA